MFSNIYLRFKNGILENGQIVTTYGLKRPIKVNFLQVYSHIMHLTFAI